jgi:chemotaxis protein methyltransferase CheR
MRENRPLAVNTELSAEDVLAVAALLHTVHELTGMDFHDYARSALCRRIQRALLDNAVDSVTALDALIRKDPVALARVSKTLTLSVTSMFRDPSFFLQFREQVVPLLHTHPFLRLWVAGCASGQEVYSLAILLHEAGLYQRARIYATELQSGILEQACNGIYPLAVMQEYTRNYQAAGGLGSFSDYYTADSSAAIMRPFLRTNVVFAAHNLVSDSSFNEFQVIFCRNVMIYFNRTLQGRVHALLHDSLVVWGYLGLGRSETLRFSAHENHYEALPGRERIYRKVR